MMDLPDEEPENSGALVVHLIFPQGKLVCDVCAGDAEVILRRISSVQRYKAVGSKEQQENQDRMLSGNADEDNYHPFLPIWQRPKSEAR